MGGRAGGSRGWRRGDSGRPIGDGWPDPPAETAPDRGQGSGPATLAIGGRGQAVGRSVASEAASVPVDVTLTVDRFARLLREMRERSQLTTRQLAGRMGVERDSLTQYFYRKRGSGGTSSLRWFLRFASACGCRVYVTYPSRTVVEGLPEAPPPVPVLYEGRDAP